MSTDRRRFLSRLTLGGVALGTFPASLRAASPLETTVGAGDSASPSRRELQAYLGQPQARAYDTSWTARLTGRHKAVFDVPEIEGGSGVWRAGLWRDHYRDVLQAQPADLSPVVVIRHSAIPLVMRQEFWDEYDVGKSREVKHPMTDEPTTNNPVLPPPAGESLPPMLSAITLDAQMKSGTIVIGCDMAFGQLVSMVRRKHSVSAEEARERALAVMLPGVILQPNGIFGLTLAQEFGCSFVAAV